MPKLQKSFNSLFETTNPLEQKLGKPFFSGIPQSPGIYFFESPGGLILYVGKAKNLRSRLQSYRRARPLEVSRKTRRLLYSIEKIRWELCPSEGDALLKENAALRNLKPLFNVVNTRPDKYPFLGIKFKNHNKRLHLKLTRDNNALEEDDFQVFGAFKGRGALRLAYGALLRVLWFSAEADRKKPSFNDAPPAIFRERPPRDYQLRSETRCVSQLQAYLSGIRGLNFIREHSEKLLEKVEVNSFHYQVLLGDFQTLLDFYNRTLSYNRRLKRFHKMGNEAIPQDKIDDLIVLEKFRMLK